MRLIKWTIAVAAGFSPLGAMAQQTPRQSSDARIQADHVVIIQQPNPNDANSRESYPNWLVGDKPVAVEAAKVKGAYLGVSATPPPIVLRKQLGLGAGMGLVVDLVVPDSPASKAGLQRFDVLQKLDDQWIVNPPQLSVLVRSHKPGDEIKLTVIREGKPVTLAATLVEHELEPIADEEQGNDALARWTQSIPAPAVNMLPPGVDVHRWTSWQVKPGGAASLTWIENDRWYTLSCDADGHKRFSEKDKNGSVLFEGPLDTQEQRDKLPADEKEKLKKMEQHMGGASVKVGPDGVRIESNDKSDDKPTEKK